MSGTIDRTGRTSMTVIILNNKRHAYKRGGSHDDLSLPNHRLSLLGTMITAKGPIILILVGKHPLSVG